MRPNCLSVSPSPWSSKPASFPPIPAPSLPAASKRKCPLPAHLEGRRVIIVEDIVDTGNTIVAMKELLEAAKVKEAKVCTLLVKPEVYKKDVKLDYVAMEIPNRFIVGFGLDYDELGRNIKDIYVLDE